MKKIILLAGLAIIILHNQAQTVTDYDDNVYDTVTIGTQVWFKENLKVTHYRNGDVIPDVDGNSAWLSLTNGARCYYNNDSITYSGTHGALYNWHTVNDIRSLCPTGWRVPTDPEWSTLINYAGGSPIADTMLCDGCSLGFDALLSGVRSGFDGVFANEDNFAYFWSSTQESTDNAWSYGGFRKSAPQMNNRDYNPKVAGLSIRCLSDSTANGINEINNKEGFQIYPNPAIDRIVIVYNKSRNTNISLYNILGECKLQRELNNFVNEIDIGSLPKGIYIIKISGKQETIQKKLIKE